MTQTESSRLQELQLESQLGGAGTETTSRQIPVIDLVDFDSRRAEITEQLWNAASEVGFFQLKNHGIAVEEIKQAFAMSAKFFDLPTEIKQQYPLHETSNTGWESKAQVRPSTKAADQKESYQITLSRMQNLWPSEQELPNFKALMMSFEKKSWQLGMQILSCFADRLGFERDFFTKAHNPEAPDYQSTLRLLHYFGLDNAAGVDKEKWRAGAHTDFDCLTLLYQQEGQAGLQVCPGKEALSGEWTPVEPKSELITCNIGDMMMRWSDDQLRSTLHRVRMPKEGESTGPRYSLAFFCQANSSVMIESPAGKYDPISAADYLQQRLAANFVETY